MSDTESNYFTAKEARNNYNSDIKKEGENSLNKILEVIEEESLRVGGITLVKDEELYDLYLNSKDYIRGQLEKLGYEVNHYVSRDDKRAVAKVIIRWF